MANTFGIVSSITLPAALSTALTTPLTTAGHTQLGPIESANGNYDADGKRKMKVAVKNLITANPGADLVIAVGGLVAAKAVSDYIDLHDPIPFLVCIGRAPNEGSSLWNNDSF